MMRMAWRSGLVEEQVLLSLMLQRRHRLMSRRHVVVCLLLRENSLKLNLIIIKCEVRCFLTDRRHALHLHRESMLSVYSRMMSDTTVHEVTVGHHGTASHRNRVRKHALVNAALDEILGR